MYKRRENTTLEFDLIECHSLFEAEYIGIHVPNSRKWDIQRELVKIFIKMFQETLIKRYLNLELNTLSSEPKSVIWRKSLTQQKNVS